MTLFERLMTVFVGIICLSFCIKQILVSITAYKNSKRIKNSIKELDDITMAVNKEIARQQFFSEVEELQKENKTQGDENGKQK